MGMKCREELSVGGEKFVEAFDGTRAWSQTGTKSEFDNAEVTRDIATQTAHGLCLLKNSRTTNRLGLAASRIVDGVSCAALLVWAEDGHPTRFWVDPTTNLIRAFEYLELDPDTGWNTLYWHALDDYRPCLGSRWPMKEITVHPFLETHIYQWETAERDNSVTDATFTPPPVETTKRGR